VGLASILFVTGGMTGILIEKKGKKAFDSDSLRDGRDVLLRGKRIGWEG